MFHPLSHIYAKTHICCVETVANNALNYWHVFNWLWANAAPTLNTAFSLTNVHAKWWIHYLLISSTPLLSHVTSIYNQPKRICGVFGVFWDNCQIWATWAFSIICVCTTTFKVCILFIYYTWFVNAYFVDNILKQASVCLFAQILWHINFCRLFNAKSIFI